MTKYILSLLGGILSLFLGTLVYADKILIEEPVDMDIEIGTTMEIPTTIMETNYQIKVHNLPLAQPFGEPFTLMMSISAQFSDEGKNVTLTIDECGNMLATLPFTLVPDINYDLSVVIEKQSQEPCILTFKLLDTNQTLLTSTQIGLIPQCPSKRSIDRGLDYSLIQESENPIETSIPLVPVKKENTTTISKTSQTTKEKEISPSPKFLNYTSAELDIAFKLLVDKGVLSSSDQERLQNPLTRIEAAEMFVKIALANNLPRDANKSCTFPDMKGESKNHIAIATLACQFNIMGVNPDYTQLDNFMPSMIIPSEQLVTAFSRLIWRDLYEQPENTDYYELHLNIMYNLGLVNSKIVSTDQKLADFVIITARALHKEQLVIEDSLPEIITVEKQKRIFWFW